MASFVSRVSSTQENASMSSKESDKALTVLQIFRDDIQDERKHEDASDQDEHAFKVRDVHGFWRIHVRIR